MLHPRLWPPMNDDLQVAAWLARMDELGAAEDADALLRSRQLLAATDPTVVTDSRKAGRSGTLAIYRGHWEAPSHDRPGTGSAELAAIIFPLGGTNDTNNGWPPTFQHAHQLHASKWLR